jgi:hypothetical protein
MAARTQQKILFGVYDVCHTFRKSNIVGVGFAEINKLPSQLKIYVYLYANKKT